MSDTPGGWRKGQEAIGGEPTGGEPTVRGEAIDGGGPPTEVTPVARGGDDGPPRRTGWIVAIVALLALIALLLVLLLLQDGGDGDEVTPAETTTSVAETTTSGPTSTSTTAPTTTSTAPTTTTTSAPTTTTTAPSGPRIDSLEASAFSCPGDLTLTWTSTGAASVEVAIDTPTGVYDTGPPNGSMAVPAPCGGDTQTYYVTAIGPEGDRSTEVLTRS